MKRILILTMLVALSANLFAQLTPLTFVDSVAGSLRNQSTAGLFDSDSDDIQASEIWDLDRSFLSLGQEFSTTWRTGAAFGVAISPSLYFGVTGTFTINETFTKSQNREPSVLLGEPTDNLVKTFTSSSPFVVTGALGLNKTMGLHYTLSRVGTDVMTDTVNDALADSTTKNSRKINKKDYAANWLNELAFAMKLDNGMEFNIPVGVIIALDETYTKTVTDIGGIKTTIESNNNELQGTTPVAERSSVNIYFNPDFTMPLDLGAFNQIEFGVNANFAVSTNLNKIDSKSTGGTDTTTKRAANKEYKDITWGLYAQPTFEWNLFNNQLNFIIEPKLDFTMTTFSTGKVQKTVIDNVDQALTAVEVITYTSYVPSLEVPAGVAYRPVEWFEFRVGLNFLANMGIDDNDADATTTTDVIALKYAPTTETIVTAGFGFIISEDFFIDLGFRSNSNSFSLNNISAQLTLRL